MPEDANLQLMADLFAVIAAEVGEHFGEEGERVIRGAVRRFGRRRGENIARRVREAGRPLTVENYLAYYDMARAEGFEVDTALSQDGAEQVFGHCPLWAAWEASGLTEPGYLYCAEIDAALVEGYNPEIRFIHHCHFRDVGRCRMSFLESRSGE